MRRLAAVVLAGATPLFVSAPIAGAQDAPTAPAPPDIASDCSVDVTDALTGWIASVPDGSTLELAPAGCYRIDSTVSVSNRSNLVIDGNGATMRATTEGDQERRHLRLFGGRDLVVRDLTVRGALPNTRIGPDDYRTDREFQHGIDLRGVQGVTLDRVRVFDVFGDFVYIGPGADGTPSRDVNITSSRFVGSGRQGISVTAGERIAITGNELRGVALSIFDLEPNRDREPAREIRIEGNVTARAGSFWLSMPATGDVGDVSVLDNVMKTTTPGLVWVVGRVGGVAGPVSIQRNRLRVSDVLYATNPVGAFHLDRCTGVTITDNRATFPRTTPVKAVETLDCDGVTVEGNRFVGAAP